MLPFYIHQCLIHMSEELRITWQITKIIIIVAKRQTFIPDDKYLK